MPVDAGTSTSPRQRGSARGRLPGGLLRGGLLRAAALGTVVAVALVGGGGSSPSAPRALHTAPVSLSDPAPPATVTLAPADRQLTASWPASTESSVRGYVVSVDGTARPEQTGLTVTLTGLTNGRTYTVAVRTVTYNGGLIGIGSQGPFTGTQAATASAYPRDSIVPAAPATTTATAGDGQVTVGWTANTTDADVEGYVVHRGGTAVSGLLPRTATTWVDTGLTNDRAYTYTVRTQDTSKNLSADSPPQTATPTDLTPPAAPQGLAATAGDGQVALTWTGSPEPDLASYRLYRGGTLVATIAAPTRTSTDTGLANGTTYTYALVAVDTHGNASPASAAASATPADTTAPATPTGLTATPGDAQVALSWTASTEPDLAGYRLYRGGVLLATVARPTTAYTDTGLTNGSTYGYAVSAVDATGNESARSAPVTATPTDLTPPAVPTGLVASRGDTTVSLTWDAGTDADLAAVRVLRDGVQVASLGRSVTSWTDTGLVNDRQYAYALVAVDATGNASAASAPVLATPTDLTPPATPTGVVATAGDSSASVRWDAVPDADVATYRVLRADGSTAVTVTAPTTSATVTGLVNGTPAALRVVAVDGHGNVSAPSAAVSATPVDTTPPPVPTGVTATPQDAAVTLTWNAVTATDLASYRVLQDGAVIATVPAGTTTATATGLVNGTSYAFTVVSVDTAGNASAPSAAATATPVAPAPPADTTPPAVPGAVVATGGDHSLVISWGAVPDADLAGYRVLLDGTVVATAPAGTTTATVSGLLDGHTYVVTVVAVDTAGNASGASSPVSASTRDTTAPPAPTGVSATAGDGAATVRWSPVTDTGLASYTVLRDGVAVATVAAGTTTATVTGLTNGTTYVFRVVATDAAGNASPASAPGSATPAAAPATPSTSGSPPAAGSGEGSGLAATRDGRYVVVGTRERLEGSDTNSAYELYLLDRSTGTARRVAPLPATWSGTGTDSTNSSAVALSADGRYLALATKAALVPTDGNGRMDAYRIDLTTGAARLVSVPAGGAVSSTADGTVTPAASGSSYATVPAVAISATGDRVLFYSARTDLVPADPSTAVGLFAKDMTSGGVTRVSTASSGGVLGAAVQGPALALTPDGRYALFPASSSGGPLALYRKDLVTKELVVASTAVSPSGTVTPVGVLRDTGDVAISDDGRYVAFSTAAKVGTSTPGASWGAGLAYRKDLLTGALAALGTGQTTTWEHQVALDPSGRYGFFETAAGEVAADANGHTDVHRRDLATGALVLVTAAADGTSTTGPTGAIDPREYGPIVVLTADTALVATLQPLVTGDTNGVKDVYRKDLATGGVSSVV